MRPTRRAAAGAAALLLATAGPVPTAASAGARSLPPAEAGCTRDHLTSYSGRVLHYSRQTGRTEVRIRTDWDTTETVRIGHAGSADPSPRFLLAGRPFKPADWPAIELSRGQLRPGLRLVAWVCDDGGAPLLDWQPPPR